MLDRFSWTENEIQWYEKLIMNTADAQGMLDAAKSEGKAEGRAEGKEERSLEIARKMLSKNHPIDEIAEFTNLSVEAIQNLSK